jgi:hypothetical protein
MDSFTSIFAVATILLTALIVYMIYVDSRVRRLEKELR